MKNIRNSIRVFGYLLVFFMGVILSAWIYHMQEDQPIPESPVATETVLTSNCIEIDVDDTKLFLSDRIAEPIMNEDRAMGLLYDGYSKAEKVARWCPSEKLLFNSGFWGSSYDQMRTAVAFTATYKEAGVDHFLIITQTRPPHHQCHACQPVLGGAIFHRIENLWHLKAVNRTIVKYGSWGEAPKDMALIKIGPERYAVGISHGYLSTGEYDESYAIIGPVGKKLEQILFVPHVAGDNSGDCDDEGGKLARYGPCWSYKSKINFMPSGNSDYFDVKIVTTGSKSRSLDSVIPVKQIRQFRFAGGYVEGAAVEMGLGRPYAIQLGAFRRYQTAMSNVIDLRKAGQPGYCQFAETIEGQQLYRVRIGNYKTKEEARGVLSRLNPMGSKGIIVETHFKK